MTSILTNLITAENYKMIIAIFGLAVIVLFFVAALFKNKKAVVSVVALVFMTRAAVCCITSIVSSAAYLQSDVKQTASDYTSNLLDSYAIDSSLVEINIP